VARAQDGEDDTRNRIERIMERVQKDVSNRHHGGRLHEGSGGGGEGLARSEYYRTVKTTSGSRVAGDTGWTSVCSRPRLAIVERWDLD